MADQFLSLTAADRLNALNLAADHLGRPTHHAPYLLEKDVWVVWALRTIFESPLGDHLVFKGGTSLSKVYRAINRFSEDVDLTHDIRKLVSDMIGDNEEALPDTRSQEKRWSKAVRDRLPEWVSDTVHPLLIKAINAQRLPATTRVEGEKIFIDYEASSTGPRYVAPVVTLEFGARSTGEPATRHEVQCDAAGLIDGVTFPTATPRVMYAERTFWEKATAIHVFCLQRRVRGERFARHWHDLVCLDNAKIVDSALKDRGLAHAVAKHKTMFYSEKAADRETIDYVAAVTGALHLVPGGDAREALATDYQKMVEAGLLFEDAESFDYLIDRCMNIAERANRTTASS